MPPENLTSLEPTPQVDVIPLGGLGEIGLNCLCLAHRDEIVVIDAGLMFPDPNFPGVDIIIPDFYYLKERREQVKGIILTHGHEDHIGALPYLLKDVSVPVFGAKLTLELAKNRLEECQITPKALIEVKPRLKLSLGPFDIEFIAVNHSILDGLALAVTTPAGVIIHTGDFKFDYGAPEKERLDLYSFARYGEEGVLALLSDSTNSDEPGFTVSETEVGRALSDIFTKAQGRIVLACFASSLTRLRQTAMAAKLSKRKLLFDGRSMLHNVALARSLGYLDIDEEQIVDIEQAELLDDREVAIVVTGSQGEPLSALSRMANGEHKHINVRPGDTIIFSAKVIPGNERAIAGLVNLFQSQGANVIDNRFHQVHASGHAQIEELKLMLSLTKPRYLIPIHGELRHLTGHALLAYETGLAPDRVKILTNGRILSLQNDQAFEGQTAPTGRLLVDGNSLGSANDPVIRRRLKIAENGLIQLIVVLAKDDLALLASPKITVYGVHYQDDPDLSLETALLVEKATSDWREEQNPDEPDLNALIEILKREVRIFFRQSINRKPLIWPEIILANKGPSSEL
ncbi:MAG: ribonuclease J [Deltaproteobacteria bacterium]|jgi:ribonuclease J|nr:ribonuclease J [Deltaproteobacteria bacterium]